MKFLDCIEINPTIKLEKGKEYSFIEMANVDIYSREPKLTAMKKYTSGVKFEKGDTVIARIEPCLQNGKGFFAKNIQIGFGSTEFLVFRPKNEKIDTDFLYYLMQTDNIRKTMIGSMTGATGRQRVNNDIFNSIEISLPDVEVQKKIGSILSSYDDLIENNKKQIKLLEEAAMRLYKEWFVNLRFPGYETIKIVEGVPEGWHAKKLAEFSEIIMGQSPKSEFYNDKQRGLPFHQGVTNYGFRFVNDEIYSSSLTRVAEAGSVLFSVRAPVGRMNITKNKIVIGRGLAAINHKGELQSYLFYMLKNRFYKDDLIGNGAIYASITKDELFSQEFLMPENNLANMFNEIVKDIDQRIESVDRQITLLQQARDILLPKLMSGEIEV